MAKPASDAVEEQENLLGDFIAGLDDDVEGLLKSVGLDPPEEVDEGDEDERETSYELDDAEKGDKGDEGDPPEGKELAKAKGKKGKKGKKKDDDEDEDEDDEEVDAADEDKDFGKSISVEGADPLLIAALNEIDDLRQQGRATKKVLQKSAKVQAGMYQLLKGIAAKFADELSDPEDPRADVSLFGKSSRTAGVDEQKAPGANEVLAKSLAAMNKGLISPVEAISLQNAANKGIMDKNQLATFERLNIALGTGLPS